MRRIKKKEERLKESLSSLGHDMGAVYCFDSVGSTMDVAFGLEEEVLDRTLVVSDYQKSGRGRHGRKWHSTEGSLLFSLILIKYDISIPYSMIASYALYRAFTGYTQKVRLKWINDILWENHKKIAGVLTEERNHRTVIGMGINLNNHHLPAGLRKIATSYYIETGQKMDREKFLVSILAELFSLIADIEKDGIEKILSGWEDEARIRKRSVRVIDGKKKICGIVLGIDKKTGALKLQVGKEEVEVYEGTLFYL